MAHVENHCNKLNMIIPGLCFHILQRDNKKKYYQKMKQFNVSHLNKTTILLNFRWLYPTATIKKV